MNTTTNDLVTKLRENGHDFEWYPTTNAMIDVVKSKIPKEAHSIMDIGAGDGRVLARLKEKCENASLYGIEKAPELVREWPKEVVPVGTELFEQRLFTLAVDYIFSNPPYNNFEEWMCKIIDEGYAKYAYLVVPQRWKDSQLVKRSLEKRGASASVIYSDDFLYGDRASRARIDIVEIYYPRSRRIRHGDNEVENPFDIWFRDNVDIFEKPKEFQESDPGEDLARRFRHSTIPEMVEAYQAEYALLEKNYRSIFQLDSEILRELKVDKDTVREGLKMRMSGLKIKYWDILFKKLDAITSRLTTKSKDILLKQLTGNNQVEFTATNAYNIVLWAIKNANQYFDDQLVDLFYELSTFEGVYKYKSNIKTWEKSGWRWAAQHERKYSHYRLDYRIVVSRWKAINTDSYDRYDYPGGLHRNAHELHDDIVAVASNLGFPTISPSSWDRVWSAGEWQNWYDANQDMETLFQAKAHLNGNVHFRFSQEFIKALNIEVARILKWVKTKNEVVEEMGYSPEEVNEYFGRNSKILPSNIKLLGG